METISTETLISILGALLFCSAFFSAAETSMMALNRYRLRHLAHKKHRGALLATRLLARPDQLLGAILIGNNLVNTFITIIGTILTQRYFGDAGVLVAGLLLTFLILIFGEVTPKTLSALHSEAIAFPASFVLLPLIRLLYPAVWFVNLFSNGLLRLIRVDPKKSKEEHLSPDELKTLVRESGKLISPRYRSMLLNILDLGGMTVEDIMVPRKDITGLDLSKDLETLLDEIATSEFTRLPVFNSDINNIIGILHMKQVIRFIKDGEMPTDKSFITENMAPAYFVPESTALNVQLLNFQKEKLRIGIVVNEYGDVKGLITLEDLLEEIVGEFTTNIDEDIDEMMRQADGSVIIDCSSSIRDVNRYMHWNLPVTGPKTLNGLITEHLGDIPDNRLCFEIDGYRFEVIEISDNRVKRVRASEQNKNLHLFGQ